MNMINVTKYFLGGIVISCLLTACNNNDDKQANSEVSGSSETTKLKPLDFIIDWQAEPTYLGIYYAIDSGEFEKAGYDVKIQTSWGAHQAIAAIASGKYVIGTASGGATVLAQSNNTPIKSLGVLYNDIPTVVYGIASKSMATSPKDIEGMKVGIYPGSITNNEFEAFVKANNLDMNKITKVSLSGGDIPVLLSGEVDAVLNYTEMSPVVVDINKDIPEIDGKRTWRLHLKDYGVKSYGLNVITSESAFAKDPQGLNKIAQAVFNGYSNACGNVDDAVEKFVARFPDKDPTYMKTGYHMVCDQLLNHPIGTQTNQGWQETISLFDNLGLLPKPVNPDSIIAE